MEEKLLWLASHDTPLLKSVGLVLIPMSCGIHQSEPYYATISILFATVGLQRQGLRVTGEENNHRFKACICFLHTDTCSKPNDSLSEPRFINLLYLRTPRHKSEQVFSFSFFFSPQTIRVHFLNTRTVTLRRHCNLSRSQRRDTKGNRYRYIYRTLTCFDTIHRGFSRSGGEEWGGVVRPGGRRTEASVEQKDHLTGWIASSPATSPDCPAPHQCPPPHPSFPPLPFFRKTLWHPKRRVRE